MPRSTLPILTAEDKKDTRSSAELSAARADLETRYTKRQTELALAHAAERSALTADYSQKQAELAVKHRAAKAALVKEHKQYDLFMQAKIRYRTHQEQQKAYNDSVRPQREAELASMRAKEQAERDAKAAEQSERDRLRSLRD